MVMTSDNADHRTTDDGPATTAATASPPTDNATAEAPRGRKHTQAKILRAVGEVIAESGFNGLGVNAIARRAGVNKVLIYRYFGGLDDLMATYARDLDFWPSVNEIVGDDHEALLQMPLHQRMACLVKRLIKAVHRRPLTVEIVAWRLSQENEMTRHLDQARIELVDELYHRYVEPDDEKTVGCDVMNLVRMVANGALYMMIGARNRAVVSDPKLTANLDHEHGWHIMDDAIERLLKGVLACCDSPKDSTPDRQT